jgi:hypothetical protein
MSCAGKPEAFFVVPDPFTPEVYSASSQAGAYPGLTTSDSMGQLIPIQSGDSITSNAGTSYDYGIVRAGGTNTAEWVWARTGDSFKGKDDIRNWWGTHVPLAVSPWSSNNSTMFHASSRRLFVCGASGSNTSVVFYYRNVDTDRFDVWTSAYTVTLRQATHATDNAGIALVALYDGTCLMIVRNASANDFDVYASTDPTTGSSWRLISRDILLRFNGTTIAQGVKAHIKAASSGDYVRLAFALPASAGSCTLRTFVSQDRGATWVESVSSPARTVPAITGTTDDYAPFDIVGLGQTGNFVIAQYFYSVSHFLTVNTAFGTDSWSSASYGAYICPQAVQTVILGSNESFAYVFGLWSDRATSNADGWVMGRAGIAGYSSDNAPWAFTTATSINGYDGMDFLACRAKMVWAGNTWFVYSARKAESTGASGQDPFGWYFGDWTLRSLGQFGPSQIPTAMTNTMWDLAWYYSHNQPQDGAGTAWTRTLAGTGAMAYTASGMQASASTVGSTSYFAHADTTPGTWYTSGGVWAWTVRLDTTSGGSRNHAVTIRIADAAGGYYYQVTAGISSNAVNIIDDVSASTISSVTGLTINTGSSGAFHVMRLYVGAGGTNCRLEVLDTSTGQWSQSTATNLTRIPLGAGYTSYLRFGIQTIAVAGAQTSWWRDFQCTMDGTALNRTAANMAYAGTITEATNLLFGQPCSPAPQYLEQGLYVSWSGMYGTEGDEWNGTLAYSYPKEAVLVDSPRIAWRTNDVSTTGQVVLYIGDSVDRFIHNAIALFGCNNRYALVDYDSNAAFSSPSGAQTVDFTMYGSGTSPYLSVDQVSGNSFSIAGSSFKWTAGELVGCYVRIIYSTTPAAIGRTFKITRHPLVNRIHFDAETSTMSSQGVNPTTTTFCIFSPNGVLKYSGISGAETYMRIRLADTDTAEGYHQLGTIVAGVSIDVDVPMDWAHTDNEQPNVTSYRTKSGIAWAFQEGPSQRTIEGRVVGDAERWREKFRNMMRQIGYEGKACALVLNADQTPETLMLGRVKSGASLDQAGWYRDSFGIMRTAGDLSLTFVEEK